MTLCMKWVTWPARRCGTYRSNNCGKTMNMDSRLRRAGLIVGCGLAIQLFSLLPLHPLAFIAFTALGVPVTGAGIIYFLLSIVGRTESADGVVRDASLS